MSVVTNGVVQSVQPKMIAGKFDKFGKPMKVFNIIIDGKPYNVGFKKPPVEAGDVVSFNHAPLSYGEYKVDMSTFVAGMKPSDAPAPEATKGSYQPKPFPVPYDHGDRSIIRQNALTNAREVVMQDRVANELDDDAAWDDLVNRILTIAAKFEKYSAGDYEREAAEAMSNE